MKKIIVIGCPGSGKTTFAEKLSKISDLPLFYLDKIWHKADHTHISREEFDMRLAEILAKSAWLIDGNYSRTLEPRIKACDTVFLFDLPKDVCLQGAVARIGKLRPDMPWVDTELSPFLKNEIEQFAENDLQKIFHLLEQYKEGKKIIIFHSRKEADDYLAHFKAE